MPAVEEAKRVLDRLLAEPSPPQKPRSALAADASSAEQEPSTLRLARERIDRVTPELARQPCGGEPVLDRLVAPASLSEVRGPANREGRIIHQPRALQRLEQRATSARGNPPPREPLLELGARAIMVSEKRSSRLRSLGPAELPTDRARSVACQVATDGEPSADDGRSRHRSPRATVELHRDTAAVEGPDCGHPRHATAVGSRTASYAVLATSSTSPTGAGAPASTSATAAGSRRAETMTSPIAVLTCSRIALQTSGFSRRNAVAFCLP